MINVLRYHLSAIKIAKHDIKLQAITHLVNHFTSAVAASYKPGHALEQRVCPCYSSLRPDSLWLALQSIHVNDWILQEHKWKMYLELDEDSENETNPLMCIRDVTFTHRSPPEDSFKVSHVSSRG